MSIPSHLGKYEVLELLAKGGMAEVYRGRAVGIAGFERIVAIKRILPKFGREPRFIRSFIDEARVAVLLNHKNIVQVLDFGKSDGELFLTMELIDGVNLKSALEAADEAERGLPTGLAYYVISEVAAGLDYAHRKKADGQPLNIVHCDVSPHNVMLSFDGFVKLLDFGVSRASFTSQIQGRRLRGKPRYMAPEQTLGQAPTPASDTFALGTVAWEALTGLRLFEGNDVREVLAAVRRAEAPDVAKLNPDVSTEASSIIARALSVDPTDRPGVGEIAMLFGRASRDLAEQVGSQGLSSWLSRLLPRPDLPGDLTMTTQIKFAEVSEWTGETGDTALEELSEDRFVDFGAPSLALLERRRVVASVVLIEGGASSGRAELRRNLATLAYKRNAIVPPSDDDELVAIFGLEIAGEDDVAAAMQYSLDAIELTREASSGAPGSALGIRIATRAGIPAIRRDNAYDLGQQDIGQARDLARESEAGRALLAGPTGRLASANFSFREKPSRRTTTGRVRVLELIGPMDFDQRARALSARRGRFFGRARELGELVRAVDQSEHDTQLRAVALTGEPGVGKSRLVAEFAAHLQAHPSKPARVAVAATPDSKEAPFSLLGDILSAAFNLPPGRGQHARSQLIQRLRHALESVLGPRDRDEVVATIEQALEVRDGARVSDVQPSARLRERITATFRRLRDYLPTGRPHVLIAEDLHHADATSINVLSGLLAKPTQPGPHVVVVTARFAAALPTPIDIHIELEELDELIRDLLIKDRLGAATDEDAAIHAVAELAGGNPLFIEELSAALKGQRDDATPSSLRELIMAGLDRLTIPAKATLQHAAVIGPVVRGRMLEELLASDLSDPLTALIEEGLLSPVGPGQATDAEGELRFRHGLIREVVYDSLTDDARTEVHLRVGQLLALRHRAGRDEPPSVIARHLAEGGDRSRAAGFWRLAGDQAMAVFDAESAADFFSRAIDHAGPDADEDRWAATLGHCRALIQLGRHEELDPDLLALRQLSWGTESRQLELSILSAERHIRLGNYSDAISQAAAADRLAVLTGDELSRGHALVLRGEAQERTGSYRAALESVDAALTLFRDCGASWETLHAQVELGRIHVARCHYRQAEAAYLPILEQLDTWSDPWLERLSRNQMAVVQLRLGQFERAFTSAEQSLDICRRHGDLARTGDNKTVTGMILASIGLFAEAKTELAEAQAIHHDTGSIWSKADCLVHSGTVDIKLGNRAGGLDQIAEGLSIARTIGARYVEAHALVATATGHLEGSSMADISRALDSAVAAEELAASGELVGAQIAALITLAMATWRSGDLDRALVRGAEATTLLDAQQYIDFPEEEIYLLYATLCDAGLDDRGRNRAMASARAVVERKLDALQRPLWRSAYQGLPTTRAALGR